MRFKRHLKAMFTVHLFKFLKTRPTSLVNFNQNHNYVYYRWKVGGNQYDQIQVHRLLFMGGQPREEKDLNWIISSFEPLQLKTYSHGSNLLLCRKLRPAPRKQIFDAD